METEINKIAAEPTIEELISTAKPIIEAGCRIIPCINKAPKLDGWNKQGNKPTINHLTKWLSAGQYNGIGIVCGSYSGNRYVLDFESMPKWKQFVNEVKSQGMKPPSDKLIVKTGVGVHFHFRCDEQLTSETNLNLALFAKDSKNKQTDKPSNLAIELLAEGKFCVLPPSVHSAGRAYELMAGDLANPPTLTIKQAERLIEICRSLDEAEAEAEATPTAKTPNGDIVFDNLSNKPKSDFQFSGQDVIEAYNSQNSIEQKLIEYGYTDAGGGMYCHPSDSNADGSVHILDEKLSHHFGTSDSIRGMGGGADRNTFTPFGLFCAIEHHGDAKQAIRAASAAMGRMVVLTGTKPTGAKLGRLAMTGPSR